MVIKQKTKYIKKVTEKESLGVPMTPGYWTGPEKYRDVTRIYMTSKSNSWYELIKKTAHEKLAEHIHENIPLITKTYDGKNITLNLQYMVKAEDVTLVEKEYYNKNTNYTTGKIPYVWMLPLGKKVKFNDSYDGYGDMD